MSEFPHNSKASNSDDGKERAVESEKAQTGAHGQAEPKPEESSSKQFQNTDSRDVNSKPTLHDDKKTSGETGSSSTPAAQQGRRHAPALGSRIEVLWRIESDDPEEGTTPSVPTVQDRWWGAVVQDCTNETIGSAVKAEHASELVHILLYDAWGEFEDETARVAFLPDCTLIDLARVEEEDKGILDWRVEGDEEMQDKHTTLEEFATEQDALVEAAGLSADADLQALSQMPANVQLHMTAGYRVFADGVKQMLRELVASKPPGYVITESDVQSIYARVRAIKECGGR